MSELINNKEFRQKELKRIIMKLHDGASPEEVRDEFARSFDNVSGIEIAEMEQQLIKEGMPIENIQLLCDVHSSVFRGSIEKLHSEEVIKYENSEKDEDGYPKIHPISILKRENRWLEKVISDKVLPALKMYEQNKTPDNINKLIEHIKTLSKIDIHYARKENTIFPIMEKNNVTGPPQVMWGVDDEIRNSLKNIISLLEDGGQNHEKVSNLVNETVTRINEMIFKEEDIMLPMLADFATDNDWENVAESSMEFEFLVEKPEKVWRVSQAVFYNPDNEEEDSSQDLSSDKIKFDAGELTTEEINAILNTVPIDMTFVGADNRVKYISRGKERIFDRPISVLGREVKHCHPPTSVDVVEQIVEDLRSGKKDNEDFWIKLGDKFVYIRYFAVRNAKGEYLGVLETSHDIKPIRDLEGEKRLRSEK